MKLEALVPLTLLLAACAQDAAPAPAPSEPAAAVHAGSQAAPAAAPLAVRARSKDPELVRLRSALEFGRLAEAEPARRYAGIGRERAPLRSVARQARTPSGATAAGLRSQTAASFARKASRSASVMPSPEKDLCCQKK